MRKKLSKLIVMFVLIGILIVPQTSFAHMGTSELTPYYAIDVFCMDEFLRSNPDFMFFPEFTLMPIEEIIEMGFEIVYIGDLLYPTDHMQMQPLWTPPGRVWLGVPWSQLGRGFNSFIIPRNLVIINYPCPNNPGASIDARIRFHPPLWGNDWFSRTVTVPRGRTGAVITIPPLESFTVEARVVFGHQVGVYDVRGGWR